MYSGAVTALTASEWEDFLLVRQMHVITTPTRKNDLNEMRNW